jgi:hypothetical protein
MSWSPGGQDAGFDRSDESALSLDLLSPFGPLRTSDVSDGHG